jgi:hypothetical protein
LAADRANLVAAYYLTAVQGTSPGEPDDWVKLDEQMWEHATWLTGAQMETLLEVLLERNWIEHQPDKSAEDQVAAVIAQDGQFVALCEPGGRFRGLVDRNALIQEAARRA